MADAPTRNNSSIHDNNESSSSSTASFPTGSTVPFPYETPYPQQVALMDALLQTLQTIRRTSSNSDSSSNSSSSTTTTATTTTTTSSSSLVPNNRTTTKRTCPVLMLESPTGTGKSLSLACSAVAWLRHVEQEDLMLLLQQQQQQETKIGGSGNNNNSNNDNNIATTTASTSTTAGLDWLDDWIPPEQRDAQRQQFQIRQQAATARAQLAQALEQVNTCSSFNKDDNDKDDRQKQRRANAVRLAVAVQKKKDNPKRFKQQRSMQQQQQQQDYCLPDYRSDTAAAAHDDDDDSDLEDFGNNNNNNRNKTVAASSKKHSGATVAVAAPPPTPSQLLSGPALDGSLSCNNRSNGSATITTTTVGQVAAGSGVRKIVYAARTHSQLSQFVGELRRQQQQCGSTSSGSFTTRPLRVVALGGRKALCGNRHLKHHSEAVLTETCLDLQKGIKTNIMANTSTSTSATRIHANNVDSNNNNNKKKKRKQTTTATTATSGCPLLGSRAAVDTLALHTLAQPTDIEEASQLGEMTQTCAYYATRSALPAAEVVVLPYSMLLSAQTRAAVGLSLQQALVIIDEAHNVPEALRALHACRLSLPVVQAALDQLSNYVQRYAQRLAGRNIQYLGQIRKILLAFEKHLKRGSNNNNQQQQQPQGKQTNHNKMKTPGELLIELKLDNINLFKVLNYLEKTRLAQKLLGFITQKEATTGKENEQSSGTSASIAQQQQQQQQQAYAQGELSKHVSAMSVVQSFLEKLVHSDHEGKVVTDWPTTGSIETTLSARTANHHVQHPTLRYVLLQPAAFFDNVLQEAHALCLVGGTLRPFVHVAAELLGQDDLIEQAAIADQVMQTKSGCVQQQVSKCYSSPSFTAFTCDHVVPSSHVLLQCWSKGAKGGVLDFRHQSRSTHAVMDELGESIVEICQQVPNGVVVFVPSYSYEAQLVQRWKRTGLWERLQTTKGGKIHREPKQSQQIEASLQRYAQDAVQPAGALLFSVVGGKMSEGINFSNEMARCVMVVGLPYPSIADPEIQEKMAIMDDHHKSTGSAISGQAYYQNLCLRAINQSVGRAIRHAKDYAAIVLLDRRYNTDPRIRAGLPEWLKRGETSTRGGGGGGDGGTEMNHRQRLAQLQCFFAKHQSK